MNKEIKEKTVAEIVAHDYRTASVFTSFGIDFCCKGNQTMETACERKDIALAELQAKLAEVTTTPQDSGTNFSSWELDLLADYIQKKHHRYVENQIPILKQYLDKLCRVHGDRHPELFKIAEAFNSSAGELAKHMKKEELVLFPYVRQMVAAKEASQEVREPHFMTVRNPIQMMLQEHEVEGDRFQQISELSHNYTPPVDACSTYRVTYALLKEFEEDLHMHIHLENNILFPKSEQLEQDLKAL